MNKSNQLTISLIILLLFSCEPESPDPVGKAPIASFTASETNTTVGLDIQYTDQSTNNPTSWNWSFGDGNNMI